MTSISDEQRTTSHLAAATQRISPKVAAKLKSLFPTASKETLQTHSKWILFHSTRHGPAICKSLLKTLLQSCFYDNDSVGVAATNMEKRQLQQRERDKGAVYLSIIHEMVIMYSNKASEWNRHSKFRLRLGKSVLRPFLEKAIADLSYKLTTAVMDCLKRMVEVWKELDCFSGDDNSTILIDDISRLILQIDTISTDANNLCGDKDVDFPKPRNSLDTSLNDSNADQQFDTTSTTKESTVDTSLSIGTPEKAKNSPLSSDHEKEAGHRITITNSEDASMNTTAPLTPTATDDDLFGIGNDEDDDNRGDVDDVEMKKVKKTDAKRTTNQSAIQEKELDFESEGIPYQKVEINQLQPPCKSIATVQITRDLHSDTAQSLSTLLSTVPDPVLKACQNTLTQPSQKGKGDEIDLNALAPIPDPVLDLNLKQDLSNVRSHRDIVHKQKVAREALVNLLIQSRCKFGSKETAELYYGMRETIDRLQSCKSKVLDAMELEGLDRDGIDDDGDGDSHGDMKETYGDKAGQDALKDFEWFTRDESERESKRIRLEDRKS